MKNKDCEKLSIEYGQGLYNIQVGLDSTDHICFYCPICKMPMEIVEVFSKKVIIDFEKNRDYCTWVYLVCHTCKRFGQRKFYWNTEDGKFCFQKTFDIDKICKKINEVKE